MRILTFLVVVGSLILTAKCTSSCLVKNQFLGQLADSSPVPVLIYSTPNQSGLEGVPQCGSEWKTYGTCCDREDLYLYFIHEAKMIEADYQAKITSFIRIIHGFYSIIKTNTGPLVEYFNLFGDSGRFQRKLSKCKESLLEIRGNALCSVCSGRSDLFFNSKKNRLLLDLPTCKRALDACEPAFYLHDTVVKKLKDIINNLIAVTIPSRLYNIMGMMEAVDLTIKYAPPKYLIDAFERLKLSDSEKEIDEASVSACSLLIDILKKPFSLYRGAFAKRVVDESLYWYEMKKRFPSAFQLWRNYQDELALLEQQRKLKNKAIVEELEQKLDEIEREKISSGAKNVKSYYLKESYNTKIREVDREFSLLNVGKTQIYKISFDRLRAQNPELANFSYQKSKEIDSKSKTNLQSEKDQKHLEYLRNIEYVKMVAQKTNNHALVDEIDKTIARLGVQTSSSRSLDSSPSIEDFKSNEEQYPEFDSNSTDYFNAKTRYNLTSETNSTQDPLPVPDYNQQNATSIADLAKDSSITPYSDIIADSQILIKVEASMVLKVSMDYPEAFVVDRTDLFEPANMTLNFP